ncbi:MAG: hypothetical protein IPK60_06915 [Sandaracinaceae bacterium]|jgi:predicted small lipoprotein YifL|nr:hypothetical protein [Sandaracinaceae bacterium]
MRRTSFLNIARLNVARALVLAAVAMTTSACGSKTGLNLPDASRDAVVPPMPALLCIDVPMLPEDQPPVELPVSFSTRLQRADIVFLIDVTASMGDEIDQIRDKLRDVIAPAIEAQIPDIALGVASFADFPVEPYGDDPIDDPFTLQLPMTRDISAVQGAVNALQLESGHDQPEAQVEALYQLATGAGIGRFVPPSFGCPRGGFGYPCYREDSLPLVFLFTDAPFHNGPSGSNPYGPEIVPPPHQYIDAIRALRSQGIRVLGFFSGDVFDSAEELESLARDTAALDVMGNPLVFNIGFDGASLDTSVVEAIQAFAQGIVLDVDAVVNDPNPDDGVDVRRLVSAVVPLRAEPMNGIESIDLGAGVFRGVRAGTQVTFQVQFRNDVIIPTDEPQIFEIELEFRGDGRRNLGRSRVRVVIPAIDGAGCDSLVIS